MKINFNLLGKYIYWKLIGRQALEKKIINLKKQKFSNPNLPILLFQWKILRYTFDGTLYNEKGYFIKFKKRKFKDFLLK